ncbi:EamA domain-containing membrane protein RarD [Rhodobacter viridis]|uniref:EamA domain-containing membrane protein RarD n=1 Tax=Rhodobacter viridis TaxID=1054202 RepID=A0A318TXD0_9RHOB|nr:DMT family transporter [Rhodobacter viridis]PYF09636.1 EamA domain-containing membrane protein RarD [Rhodobacter viridis]
MRYGTGMALVIAAGLLWSFQALIIRQIDAPGPWPILFWRSATMVAVVILFLRARGTALIPALRRGGMAGVIGGLGLVVAMGGAILAFQSTSIANAAFLFAASPFLTAVLGRLVLREAVATRTWSAIGVALVGIFIMVQDGLASGAMIGNIAALLSAFGFATFTVALRWRRIEDSFPATVLGGIFASLVAAMMAGFTGQELLLPAPDLLWCALMGMGTLAGGMILYTLGSRVVPSAELTLLSNVEVMLAPVWVWLVMGETARAGTLLGGAILLTAIVLNAAAGVRQLARA